MQAGHSLQAQDYEKYERSCEQVVALTAIICGSHSVEARDVQVQLEVARQIVAATPERQQQICAILKDIIRSNDLLHQNDIPASNKLARETLRRCRKVLGPKHPTTAGNMEFVGTGYVNERDFDHGIPLLKEAVAIRQELAGEQDVTVGRAQGLLATAYSRAGRNAETTKTFIAALAALEDNDAHVSIAVANTMADYGGHLLRSGQPKAAQEQLVKCLAEFQRCGAATDPNSLLAYQKLAEAYRAVGDNSNADKILGVFELLATQGNVGSTTAGISLQTTRAKHLYLQKKYQESVIEYHKATTEIGRIFGQRSSNYEQALEDLLEVYLAMRNTAGVERVLRELLDFARLRREAAYYASTPREQFENTASDRIWVNRLMALATNGMISPVVAYEHLLSIKGAVTLNQRRMQLAASRPELRPLLKQRQHTSAQISALLGQAMTEANSAKLDQLARTRDEIDVQMATKSDQYRQIAERPTVARLCEQLPADAAIVDYVEFDRPADWLARIFAVEHELSLAAFVTTKSGEVRLIELGAAGFIARSLGHWAEAIGAEVQNLGPTFDAKLEQATDSAGADLRQRVWDPLPADVRNSKLVIISPDGLLALCSFAALPLPDGRYLTENSAICYLPAVGLLPELLSRKTRADRESLLLVDDVDYDVADGLAANSATVNRLRFSALPNEAGLETDPVRAYFERRFPARKMVQLTRNRATEAKFRQQLAGASIVHLSTHGFCLPLSQLLVVPEQPDQPPVLEFDPLVAGVALAGANHSTYEDGLSDGILWASEISTLDLSGVDLVTLSACQTAMGNLVAGEGLQGTQRALIVAGAHSSLASLWNADDKATRVVMQQFYRSAWVYNNTKAQSLRQAMNYMLRKYPWRDGLAQEAKWHRCPPWLWSSWMLYGDWH